MSQNAERNVKVAAGLTAPYSPRVVQGISTQENLSLSGVQMRVFPDTFVL